MKTRVKGVVVGIALLVLSFACSSTVFAVEPAWGDTVGPVSAVVGRTDTEQGLAVRAGPSPEHVDYLEPRGGTAEVISVDKPVGCLNIRSGPGSSYRAVGCAPLGEKLELTGIWSENNWAELTQPVGAWVFAGQIRSGLEPAYPPDTRVARGPIYEEEPLPYYDFDEPSVAYNYIYRYPPLYWTDRYFGLDLLDGFWPFPYYGYWPNRYYSYWPHRYRGYRYWGKRHPKYGVRIGGKRHGRRFGWYGRHPKRYSTRGHRTYKRHRSRSSWTRVRSQWPKPRPANIPAWGIGEVRARIQHRIDPA
ncbi:MAG: hypothetical protein P8182_18160 [Deltaproteobacteria bacterium]